MPPITIRPSGPYAALPAAWAPSYPEYVGEPLSLTASVVVKANSSGAVNTSALKNPTGAAMEIREIKFEASIVDMVSSTGERYAEFITPGVMGVDLALGKIPLTNGFVPAWCLGQATHLREEGGAGDIRQGLISGTKRVLHSWRLSRPLYVPAGGVIAPVLQHRGGITQPLNMRITLSARSLNGGQKPTRISVPYAAAFVSKTFEGGSARDLDESRELDLVNPFDQPLTIERFTGRLPVMAPLHAPTWIMGSGWELNEFKTRMGSVYQCIQAPLVMSTIAPSGTGTNIDIGNGGLANYIGVSPGFTSTETDIADFGYSLFSVRMLDSSGFQAVREWTLFRNVFPPHTRSWEMQHVLPPKGFYRVFLAKDQPEVAFNATIYPYLKVQTHIGMVGWREVRP